MRRRKSKIFRSKSGKVVTGLLIGSVVGATIGWLTAPTTGAEMRRRISGEVKGVREKARTAKGNVESRARELIEEVGESVDTVNKPVSRRKKATPIGS